MSEPTPRGWTFQFPLWVLLFVLPTMVALASAYFLLIEGVEKEIVVQLQVEQEKEKIRRREEGSLKVLQKTGLVSEEDWGKLTSSEAVWDRLIHLQINARQYAIRGRFGPYTEVRELRLFRLRASDEQVLTLIRLAEQEAWKGDTFFALAFLREVPEIFPGRLDTVEPELIRAVSSLAESDRWDVSRPAKDLLRQLRSGLTQEQAHGE